MSTQRFPHCPGACPVAFPSAPAAAERNRQHVQAGTRQKGRQRPPTLARHFCSGAGQLWLSKRAGTREEPVLCFPSDTGTPWLLSLPCSVHRTGDQILSLLASRALFLLPSKKKKTSNPFSGPPGTLTKSTVQRQRAALEKPNPASDLSPLAPGRPELLPATPGAAAPAQPCELRGKSLPFSCYCKSCFFPPVFPEFVGKRV